MLRPDNKKKSAGRFEKFIVWLTICAFLGQPTFAAAQTVADPNAPAQNRPSVESAKNGISVVQIAAPSAAGVSHNLYQSFNIDPQGIILNNSRVITQTQLAGYIMGNPNLARGSARIVLNEVTGTNPSNLRGYLEVAGQRADVIIANPNGIYGNGFGFINTSRAVLTTGIPVFGGNGSLDAFRVTGGQISVQGQGMDASTIDRADIIARAVSINAGIWAKDLNVVTGANQVNYVDLSTQNITGDANQPAVALDVGALGGMYANKIILVGTEAGVGVNSQGTISAGSSDLTLTNEGKIILAGSTTAAGNINVNSHDDVTNQGTIYAQGNTNISSTGTLTNIGVLASAQNTTIAAQTVSSTGTLGAGINSDGSIGSSGDLTVTAAGAMTATGQNIAGGNLTVTGASINHGGALTYAGGNANITAANGDINHTGATMQIGGNLTINAAGTVINDQDANGNAGRITAGNVTITAGSISNQGGSIQQTGANVTTLTALNTIDNTGGAIATNGSSLYIHANMIANNQGQISHDGTDVLTINATGDVQNSAGTIVGNGQVSLRAQNVDNTLGAVAAQKQIDVNAASLTSNWGTITSGDAINITAQGDVNNRQGTIQANRGLALTAQSLDNQNGNVTSLDASDTNISVNQNIQNQSGLLGGNGNVNVTGGSLANQGGRVMANNSLTIAAAQGTDNTNGTIAAGQNATINHGNGNLANTGGAISAGGTLYVQAAAVDNTGGNMAANQNITLTAQSLNGNGQAAAGQDLNITLSGNLTNGTGGKLQANRDVNMNAAGTALNQGSIIGVRNVTVTGGNITNDTNATTASGNALNISAAGDMNNNGQLSGTTVTINSQNLSNTGTVTAGTLAVQANTITNSASGVMNSTGDLNAAAGNGGLTNQGTVYARGNANIGGIGTLTNSGVLASAQNTNISAKDISSTGSFGAGINSDGSMGNAGDLTITASGAVTAKGQNLAAVNLTVTGSSVDQSGATTYAGGNAAITAANGDINHTGATMQITDNLSLSATGSLRNDKDANGNVAIITANKMAIIAGGISNQGGMLMQTGTEDTTLAADNGIDNTGGTIATNGASLTLQTGTVTNNQGQIQHAGIGILAINSAGDVQNNGGTIATNGQVDLRARDIDNTQGTIAAQKQLTINAASLTNNQGVIAGGDAVGVTVQNTMNNRQAIIQARKGLTLAAGSLDNNSGSIINLDTSDTKVAIGQIILNESGLIGGNGNVNVTGQSLGNESGQVIAKNNLAITAAQGADNTNGTVSAGQDITLNYGNGTMTNAGGTISAGSNLNVQAAAVDNTDGNMLANVDINLNTQSLSGVNGQLTAGQDVNIISGGDFTHGVGSQVQANRHVNVNVTGMATNEGDITAVQNVNINGGNITNDTAGTTAAGELLNITATDDFTNNGTATGSSVTVTAGQGVTNTGAVLGDNITVTADSIGNSGTSAVIAAIGDVNLYARTSLENKDSASIYSASNINIAGSASKDAATGEYTDKTGSVLNQSATIEASNNIGIYANQVINQTEGVVEQQHDVSTTEYIESTGTIYSASGSHTVDNYNLMYGGRHVFPAFYLDPNAHKPPYSYGGWIIDLQPQYLLRETVTDVTITSTSPQGKILAGNNMTLRAGTVTNTYGQMMAAVQMDAQADTINNLGGGVRQKTRLLMNTTGQVLEIQLGTIVAGVDWRYFPVAVISSMYTETTSEPVSSGSLSSVFGGGQSVSITAKNINNLTVIPGSVVAGTDGVTTSGWNQGAVQTPIYGTPATQTVNIKTASGNVINPGGVPISNLQGILPLTHNQSAVSVQQTTGGGNITLPSNGMYNIHPETTARYLVETDPRFTSYGNFISSDYMLQQLNIDPAKTLKQVGDGFYQQQLVRDQLVQLTGRQVLSGYKSNEDEFKALMNSGITYAQQFDLQVGVALTAEQMAKLTSPMVWLVEQEVAGQKVLAPVVYLSQLREGDLKADGAVISADGMQINLSGNINNTGTVKGLNNLQVNAVNVNNLGGTVSGENLQVNAVNVNNLGGIFDSGNIMQIVAGQDLFNLGGTISGKNIQLIAGRDLSSETLSVTGELPFSTVTTLGNIAGINAGQNLTINAGRDISLTATRISAGTDFNLFADGGLSIGSVAEQARLKVPRYLTDKVVNTGTVISAGDSVGMTAQNNITMQGSQINAGKDLRLVAGADMALTAVQDRTIYSRDINGFQFQKRNKVVNEVSSLQAGENIQVNAGADLTFTGVQAEAGQEMIVTAAGDLSLGAVKDSCFSDVRTGNGKNYNRNMSKDETVVGTNLAAGSDVAIGTNGIATIVGSSVTSDAGKITLATEQGVDIQEVTEKHESLVESRRTKKSFFSKKVTDKRDYTLVNAVVGSTISGNTVDINSGQDINLRGSNVVGTNDVNLTAQSDVNITSAQKTGAEEHYSHTKKSGIFGGGGFGFTIGSQSMKRNNTVHTIAQVGSTVGSINGEVNIISGEDTHITASNIIGNQGINISGQNVTIDAAQNTAQSKETFEFKQSGLSVSLGGGVISTATNAINHIQRASEVEDSRLQALYEYKAVKEVKDLGKELKGNIKDSLSLSISIGSSKSKSETVTTVTSAQGSTLTSDQDIKITATGSGAQTDDGNINIVGSTVFGQNIDISATKDINLQSADNTSQSKTTSSGSSFGIGVSFGAQTGAFIQGSKSSGKANETGTTHTETTVTAEDTLTVKSGNDTNIIGVQAKGETVKINVGGDLNIVSQQDAETYTERNSSLNASIGLGGNMPSTGSFSTGKINSNYQSVTDPTGIYAGVGGFDIEVGKNTDLKGAVISSEATPDKNRLSTGSLTWSDIENKAAYKASGFGINYSSKDGEKGSGIAHGITPSLTPTVEGDANSTTKSAISPGEIIIGGVKVDPRISRNPETAVNALSKIFDKKTVQEQQELASLFGQMAYEAVGEIARKHQKEAENKLKQAIIEKDPIKAEQLWKEAQDINSKWGQGGTNKIALHALVGGLMSDLSGNGFGTGAVAGGLNEALQKGLGEWEENHPAANQWASLVIGAAVGGMTGGTVAVSGTKYNWDDTGHNSIIDLLNYPSEQAEKMRQLNYDYDHSRATQKDPFAHSSPLGKVEQDYINAAYAFYYTKGIPFDPDEVKKAAIAQYETDQENWRVSIRERCKTALEGAIVCKNSGDEYGALKKLVEAEHIVTDDRPHRQSNVGWIPHAPMDVVGIPTGGTIFVDGEEIPEENKYLTPSADNMFNSGNFDKFKDSTIAAQLVNDMYQKGDINGALLDKLFPKVGADGLRAKSWTDNDYLN